MTIVVGTPRALHLQWFLLSHLSPLCLTVGKSIEVQKTLHPSQEEVDRLHQCYVKKLEDLFEAHKFKNNVPIDQHLEFC